MTEQRRLAAIVSADVVGYSRLMGRDESGTLAALKGLRRELVDPAIAARGGRIVKTTGDGMLLEFASVVDAVRCVLAIQTAMAARNADVPEDCRIVFRVGVNLGDIIIDGDDDIFGDGVNIAARLQAIAQPGGIAISRRVHEDVRDRLEAVFEDAGEQTLKNIARPVSVWRWVPDGAPVAAPSPAAPSEPALPDKPAIAVLPFQNMSGDPEQEYFADGMVEEITTALSRTRWLFVIARNSSFTYKGRAVDVKQVGRELGVRYVLEGSVRKAGERVRITAQLIDAATGAHLWAERFDGALADVFDLQDQVTASVAGAIRPELERAEAERARRKPTASLDAYDLYLRALPAVEGGSRAAVDEALALLSRAIALDPRFAAAYGLAARCHALRDANDWSADPAQERTEAARFARLAIEFGRDDPLTLSHAGYVLARSGEIEDGVAFCVRAVALDPHLATALRFSGVLEAYLGNLDAAIERLTRAMRFSPRDPALFSLCGAIAAAHFFSGRYDEATSWVERAIRERGDFVPMLELATACHALAGRPEEARRALSRLQRLAPEMRLSRLVSRHVLVHRPERLARYVEGLRLAGLPE